MNRVSAQSFLWGLTVTLLSLSSFGCNSKSTTANQDAPKAEAVARLSPPEMPVINKVADADGRDAADLIKEYNSRNFGSPGWRRVFLELLTGADVTRTFTVVNLWEHDGETVKTLFLLEEPKGLSGTNYLLTEKPAASLPNMQVHLFLPAGERRVLEVAPDNFEEGLLGSDFTYNDLRMQLPLQHYNYIIVGESVLGSEPVWVVEARPSSQKAQQMTTWVFARLYFARRFNFLMGADYYISSMSQKDEPRLNKQMRVESLQQIDGVWTATKMVMFGLENRASILRLKEAKFGLKEFDSSMLSPAELPKLADRIHQGWKPEGAQLAGH